VHFWAKERMHLTMMPQAQKDVEAKKARTNKQKKKKKETH
jgi:hypothetical protein